MPHNPLTGRLTCGHATVTYFNVGDTQFDPARFLEAPPGVDRTPYADRMAQPARAPIQCIHISLPTITLLVDAGHYDFPADSPFALPDYTPPPSLLAQMADAGLDPNLVEHVVITHAHGDHFNALTQADAGRRLLSFPSARVYLGRADWENPDLQEKRADFDSVVSQTLSVVWERGLLQPVDGDLRLSDEVTILAAPGESPGHQIVRVASAGQVLYCIGDLYHHPLEAEEPAWTVGWSDRERNLASRTKLAAQAIQEDAQIIATHIAGIGRLAPTATGVKWVSESA